jgi:hypothetical protein
MVDITAVSLDPDSYYTPAELRSIFGKQRAGRGIEELYDENDHKYIRLFSKEESEYSDDLYARPIRYVGEKDFSNPDGDQVLTRGNKALAENPTQGWPVFLFEKVSEDPVEYRYYGRVEVMGYEHNYRPRKDKREYDFYLQLLHEDETDNAERTATSGDELAPDQLRPVSPDSRDVPEAEQRITYESNMQSQAEATDAHEETVALLWDAFEGHGWECHETVGTDLLACRDEDVVVIEVKSIDRSNDQKQLRRALGQVYESCYRDVINRGWGERALRPCVAFSQRPSDRLSGYLEHLHSTGIAVLWRTGEEIGGHPADRKLISQGLSTHPP